MGLTRHNAQSLGFMVAQAHDTDFMGVDYDWSSRPINFAGRHTIVVDDDGIPVHRQVDGTAGPVGHWGVVPGAGGDSGRTLGQWGQCFPAKIYDVDPLTAGVILNQAGDFDTTLSGLFVSTIDGSTPPVDTVGVIVFGSSLAGQESIFVPSGTGGGSAPIPAVLTAYSGSGQYAFSEVTPADNSTLGGGISGTATELNRSSVIPVTGASFVWIYQLSDSGYYFFYPLAACT